MFKKFAPFFVITAAVLWGIDGIVLRPTLFTLPVTLVVFIESAIVALILSPFFIKKLNEIKILSKKDLLAFIGVALFGGAIGTMAITKALFYVNFVNLSIVILIQKLQPVFAILFASILLKEKLTTRFLLWAVTAILGAFILTFGFNLPIINSEDKTALAAFFAILASVSFALSTVLSKRALRNVTFETGTYLRFLTTSIIMLVFVLANSSYNEFSSISHTQIIIFLIIAFTTGGPAIFLYYYGLKEVSASHSTIYELAFPLSAVILEYFIHDNILNLEQWVGAIILMVSILKVTTFDEKSSS
ncbi:MAG: DMT family transporter [Melioribacteraceae bacterium]|jgi:drug/metabolite transporter (DMT)-like permease|nr:DMT family transporter [Melioribacteraceae bacterium]